MFPHLLPHFPLSKRQKVDQLQFLFVNHLDDAPVSKLSDSRARSMWISSFGAQVRMVPWSEFYSVLAASSGSGPLDSRQVSVLHQFVDFCLDGWVSVYEFEVFVLSFAPLNGCVARVLSAFDSGVLAGLHHVGTFLLCYFDVGFVSGYVSSFAANAALAGKGPGNYLVRFSKSNPGAFAVTFVDSKSRVKHCLL